MHFPSLPPRLLPRFPHRSHALLPEPESVRSFRFHCTDHKQSYLPFHPDCFRYTHGQSDTALLRQENLSGRRRMGKSGISVPAIPHKNNPGHIKSLFLHFLPHQLHCHFVYAGYQQCFHPVPAPEAALSNHLKVQFCPHCFLPTQSPVW